MGFHRVAKHGKAYVKQDRYLGERYQDRNWYTSFLALVGTRLLFYPPKTKVVLRIKFYYCGNPNLANKNCGLEAELDYRLVGVMVHNAGQLQR